MRRILIEAARRKGRIKRGGDRARVELADVPMTLGTDADELLALGQKRSTSWRRPTPQRRSWSSCGSSSACQFRKRRRCWASRPEPLIAYGFMPGAFIHSELGP